MQRSIRHWQIAEWIAVRRLTTAQFLAGKLAVSLRTIYRDVEALQAQGVAIEGAAGSGLYVLDDYVPTQPGQAPGRPELGTDDFTTANPPEAQAHAGDLAGDTTSESKTLRPARRSAMLRPS
jgi:hypothetical protein